MDLPRLYGRLALALLVSVFAVPAAAAQLVRPDSSPTPEVTSLQFEGVTKVVDMSELRASIYTDVTKCRTVVLAPLCRFTRYRGFKERHNFNRQEFKRDVLRIRAFYFQHGYREATVDTTVKRLDEKTVAVTFRIHEGDPTIVSQLVVDVDSTLLGRRKIRQLTVLKEKTPLDLFQLDSTRMQFQNELWELGYADALIDTSSVVDPIARTASIRIQIAPNRLAFVAGVNISGNQEVAEQTIRNTLSFGAGDLYRRSTVLESQRNLYESSLFKLAVLDVPLTFDSLKTVNISVREAPLHEARTSFGFNTVDYLQAEGRYTHYNFLGAARRLEISATAGNLAASALNGRTIFHSLNTSDTTLGVNGKTFLQPTYQASIQLSQPSFLQRPRDAVSIGAFAQRRSIPAVVIDRGYGSNLTYTRTLANRAPASLSYRFEVTRVEASGPYFCVNAGVCDTLTINALRSHQRLSPLTLLTQVDRADNPLSPSRGYTARGELEHASAVTLSDYRYNRLFAEGTLYSRIGAKTSVLASHIKVGFVRPLAGAGSIGEAVLHPRKRFYSGGSQSVRGYGENQLGPRILTLPSEFLRRATSINGGPCDITSEAVRFCDPNTARDTSADKSGNFNAVGADKFTPRALGGTSLFEASVEYRFPLPFIENLGGAVFLDGAAVGEKVLDPLGAGVKSLADLVRGTGAITPGFGVRYYSSVGPIRIDVGFNPSLAQNLAVVTDIIKNGKREVVSLDTPYKYSPQGSGGGIGGILNRFVLHLSIGQAY